jgi:hypothetical protein
VTAEEPPPEPPEPPPPLPLGRIAFALILVAAGVGWLLHSLDVIDVPWDALLSVALIAVGAVLVVGSRTGRYSGLIALGIVLTIATALVAAVDVPFTGGVGQREITPLTAADLDPRYDLAVGQMVIDLSQLQLQPGEEVEVEARVGIGELVVDVPEGLNVDAHAQAGLGDVQLLDQQASGFGPERQVMGCVRRPVGGRRTRQPPCVSLDLSVGLGEVRVDQ